MCACVRVCVTECVVSVYVCVHVCYLWVRVCVKVMLLKEAAAPRHPVPNSHCGLRGGQCQSPCCSGG